MDIKEFSEIFILDGMAYNLYEIYYRVYLFIYMLMNKFKQINLLSDLYTVLPKPQIF